MRQLKITKQVTNREELSLDKYLHEIGKVPLLSTDEEVELARSIRKGDEHALGRMVRANLRFVVSVAKQYQNQGLSLSDLVNEGNLGLIKAALRFDETRGFKFISYAVWWIRQSILQALAEQSRIVRLPLNKIGNINKINKMFSRLEQDYEREPTLEELSATLDIAPEEIKEALRAEGRHVSIDYSPFPDEESNKFDLLLSQRSPNPDQELIDESLRREIERLLTLLTEREADILKLYYGLLNNPQHTLDEIGGKFNLTRERVRQIKERAINKLRSASPSHRLKIYLA